MFSGPEGSMWTRLRRSIVAIRRRRCEGRLGARRGCVLDAVVLRSRRRPLIGPGGVLLIGLVAADGASGNGPDLAVPGQMARDATNDSTLDAPLCLRRPGQTLCSEWRYKAYAASWP